jgi:hypothetical protein
MVVCCKLHSGWTLDTRVLLLSGGQGKGMQWPADSCSVKFFMAAYVPRCRERALKYGKLMVGGQTHIFAEGSTGLVCIGKRGGTTF